LDLLLSSKCKFSICAICLIGTNRGEIELPNTPHYSCYLAQDLAIVSIDRCEVVVGR